GSSLARVVERAATLLEPDLSALEPSRITGAPTAFAASPVFDDGRLVGVVAVELSNAVIERLVQDFSGLGATGETVLARRVGSAIQLEASTRHDPEAAFRRRFALGSGTD